MQDFSEPDCVNEGTSPLPTSDPDHVIEQDCDCRNGVGGKFKHHYFS